MGVSDIRPFTEYRPGESFTEIWNKGLGGHLEREYEKGRQKVLDDRATTLFNQQQEDRAKAQQIRENILKADDYSSALKDVAGSEAAVTSPEWDKAFSWAQGQERFKGETADGSKLGLMKPEDILAAYKQSGGAEASDSYKTVLDIPTGVGNGSAISGVGIGRGGQGSELVQTGTKKVLQTTPGHVLNPDATVDFNVSKQVQDTTTKPYSLLEAFTGREDRIDRTGSSRLNNQLKGIETKYDKLLAPLQETMRNNSMFAKGGRTAAFNDASAKAEALIKQRDTELYQAKTMPNPEFAPKTKTVLEKRTAKISDFDTSKIYDAKGHEIKSGSQVPKNGQVFMKDPKSGEMINTSVLGTAVQKNWKDAESVEITKPTYAKQSPASATEIAQGEPVFRTTSEKISMMAKTSKTTPAAVTQELNSMGNDYKSVLGLLGEDNVKERDVLRSNMQKVATSLGLTSQDYDVEKRVNSILPANELTGRQTMAINLAIKDLDNLREDKKWQQEMNLKTRKLLWDEKMDQVKTSLQKAGLSLEREKLHAQKTEMDPLTKALLTSLGSGTGKELTLGGTIESQKAIDELLRKRYEDADKGGFLGMGETSYSEFDKIERPKLLKQLAEDRTAKMQGVQLK